MLRVTVALGAVACAAAFSPLAVSSVRKSFCVPATRSPQEIKMVAETTRGRGRAVRGEDLVLLGQGSTTPPMQALSEIIFLGTGSSSGTPMVGCVMKGEEGCEICKECVRNPSSKNARNNPSLLIRYRRDAAPAEPATELEDCECTSTIIIDVGKTFKRSALSCFAKYKVKKVHAVCLTHEHADAIMGLDDLRELSMPPRNWRDILAQTPQSDEHDFMKPMPIFLLPETLSHIKRVFPYLTKEPGAPEPKVQRYVSRLSWNPITPFRAFDCAGLQMLPVDLVHGGDCPTAGFIFGTQSRAVYLSDFNKIPPETLAAVSKEPVDLLVLDCLLNNKDAPTHIGLPTALEIVRSVRPAQALLVGMSHSFGDHDAWNKKLKELEAEGVYVQLAHEGQRVLMRL
mmetsp:Transcript_3699/g.8936  ORF Transcript_3699/g.8936 Transcript_3699/m.8936 type:complete len:399 (+) Transcript_3699:10-1206(+)